MVFGGIKHTVSRNKRGGNKINTSAQIGTVTEVNKPTQMKEAKADLDMITLEPQGEELSDRDWVEVEEPESDDEVLMDLSRPGRRNGKHTHPDISNNITQSRTISATKTQQGAAPSVARVPIRLCRKKRVVAVATGPPNPAPRRPISPSLDHAEERPHIYHIPPPLDGSLGNGLKEGVGMKDRAEPAGTGVGDECDVTRDQPGDDAQMRSWRERRRNEREFMEMVGKERAAVGEGK
ncbi:hypothetical protein P154DRAFT_532813 [Amniculicola lignicola CBS 123094]|uniref:Uncharacterized protein n=1 Tax=Amniculicola lignicola CBS 123094 TaxID=1392246 RepID=A0A6A5WL33_9PLEO|nr:hypothetical protein P154DRAFT_532813 [Amniculicola lignicola CBS 123094]